MFSQSNKVPTNRKGIWFTKPGCNSGKTPGDEKQTKNRNHQKNLTVTAHCTTPHPENHCPVFFTSSSSF